MMMMTGVWNESTYFVFFLGIFEAVVNYNICSSLLHVDVLKDLS